MQTPLKSQMLIALALAGLSFSTASAAVTPGQYAFMEGTAASEEKPVDSRTLYSVTVSSTGAYTAKAVVLSSGRSRSLTGKIFEDGDEWYLSKTKRGLLYSSDSACTGQLPLSSQLESDAELVVSGDAPSYAVVAELTEDPVKDVADFWKAFPAKRSAYQKLLSAKKSADSAIEEDSSASKAVEDAEKAFDEAELQLEEATTELEDKYVEAGYAPSSASDYETLFANQSTLQTTVAEAQKILHEEILDEEGNTTEQGLDVDIKNLNAEIKGLVSSLAALKKSPDVSDLDVEAIQISIEDLTEELNAVKEERDSQAGILAAAQADLKKAEAALSAFAATYNKAFDNWILSRPNASINTAIVSEDPSTEEQRSAWAEALVLRKAVQAKSKNVSDRQKNLSTAQAVLNNLKKDADAAGEAVFKAEEEAESWVEKWKINNKAVWLTATPADSLVVVTGSRADGKTFSYSGTLLEQASEDGSTVSQRIVSTLNAGDGVIISDLTASLETSEGVEIGKNQAGVLMGVTASSPSVVDAKKKSVPMVNSDESEIDPVAFTVRNGKVRAHNPASGNALVSGTTLTLRNGLLSGTVGAVGATPARSIYGVMGKFGAELTPMLYCFDGEANRYYNIQTATEEPQPQE
jgi:hypothetical protein